ncbi:MAG TPA: ABC transporter ATP-binding protein [Thermoanaerobaculia bacterium]|nr:ABC transporter ATP-binding protein [Thermoanaerobaculia bacterium]
MRASPEGALLAVREIVKSYGPRRVLDAVSFTVRPGEVLGLIGPNGAGKTTLFEGLAGLLPMDSGEVRGSGGRALAPAERSREIFYVPDGIAPWPDQPVCRVLLFYRDLWGGVPADRLAAVVDALQLRSLLAAPVCSLSKGERKRFLIALGLLAPQPLLMLDEPFDGLDLRQTREATAILRNEAARGRTLFLSIHQLTDAGRACDRFVLLADGRVAGEGTLPELRERAGVPDLPGFPAMGVEEVFLALT